MSLITRKFIVDIGIQAILFPQKKIRTTINYIFDNFTIMFVDMTNMFPISLHFAYLNILVFSTDSHTTHHAVACLYSLTHMLYLFARFTFL